MQIKLHFIGTGLYGAKRFIRESQRLGVNRGLPWSAISGVNFGDKIFLAEYVREDSNLELQAGAPLKKVSAGAAVIFGYYTVREFTYTNMPPAVREQFTKLFASSGLIEEIKDFSGKDGSGGIAVQRACGSYAVVAVIYLKDSASIVKIQELIRKACEIVNSQVKCKQCGGEYSSEESALTDPEHNFAKAETFNHKFEPTEKVHVSPNSIKYFLGGRLSTFKAPVVLEQCTFTRGLKTERVTDPELGSDNVDLVDYVEDLQRKENSVVFLKDYKLNSYVPAKERKGGGFVKTVLEEYSEKLKEVSEQ